MKNLTTSEFKHLIFDYEKENNYQSKSNRPIIVDFHADWCQPCKVVAPILEELEKEENFILYKVDADQEYELSEYFNIKSIPTLYFFPIKGEAVSHTGAYSKAQLKKFISKYFEQ